MISPNRILTNGVVVRNDENVVVDIFSLNEKNIETANTLFYNGLLTIFVPIFEFKYGERIADLVKNNIEIGSCGRLLLWKNIHFSDLSTTKETEILEI